MTICILCSLTSFKIFFIFNFFLKSTESIQKRIASHIFEQLQSNCATKNDISADFPRPARVRVVFFPYKLRTGTRHQFSTFDLDSPPINLPPPRKEQFRKSNNTTYEIYKNGSSSTLLIQNRCRTVDDKLVRIMMKAITSLLQFLEAAICSTSLLMQSAPSSGRQVCNISGGFNYPVGFIRYVWIHYYVAWPTTAAISQSWYAWLKGLR